jgi:hypothetical protein
VESLDKYKQEEVTIDPVKANINAILLTIPIGLLIAAPYYLIWKDKYTLQNIKTYIALHKGWLAYSGPIIIGVMIIGIVLHELIHGITWSRYAKQGFRSIKFGVLWKMITPYCHCKEPLLIRHYIIGGIMPAVVLGFLPSIIAMITGKLFLLIFGLFFTTAAAGDFMIINTLRKENMNDLVQDHPSKIGCYIFRKSR